MKTGFDLLQKNEDEYDEHQIDFLRKTVALMKILTQQAMKTSERFTKACGRTQITGNDMYYALMFEAHEFFDRDELYTRFFEELEHEKEHTYYTDDEEEESEEENDENPTEEEIEVDETYNIELKVDSEEEFHSKVIKYSNEWREWFPEDPVKSMIKNCIDKTRDRVG